ncbi:hypothetical protein SK128_007699 [Halocaridina rubra]|uniref:Lipase domain-containing protein n=1 Tax=Halocaridina rubra TaxID=373956 RepID=A0AAN8WXA1_HALRR
MKKMGRLERGNLSGLDPAGLLYHQVGPDERLDRSDADYVDIIHTNGCNSPYDPWLSCYGLDEIIGHADFWPNGGKYQPACKEQFKGDIGCDHMMSYRYFMESVDYGTNDTFFLARNCTDWQSYKVGNCSCGRYAQYMGLYSNIRLHGRFYLITNSSSPYAVRDAACAPGTSSGVSILLVGVTAGSAMLVTLCTALIVLFILKRKSSGTKAEEPDGSYSPDGGSNLNYNDDDDALLIGTQDNESDDSSLRIDEDDSGLSEDSREALIVA